jgi:hypothetical protein
MTATIEAGSGIGIATLSVITVMTIAVGFLFWCLFSFLRELVRAKQWRLRRWELVRPPITEVCSLPSARRHLHIVINGQQKKEAFRRRVAI